MNVGEAKGHDHNVGRGGAVVSHALVSFGGVDEIAYSVIVLA